MLNDIDYAIRLKEVYIGIQEELDSIAKVKSFTTMKCHYDMIVTLSTQAQELCKLLRKEADGVK